MARRHSPRPTTPSLGWLPSPFPLSRSLDSHRPARVSAWVVRLHSYAPRTSGCKDGLLLSHMPRRDSTVSGRPAKSCHSSNLEHHSLSPSPLCCPPPPSLPISHTRTYFLLPPSLPPSLAPSLPPGQGVDAASLIAAFDAVKREHEAMPAEKYNDDLVYKSLLNLVTKPSPLLPKSHSTPPPRLY